MDGRARHDSRCVSHGYIVKMEKKSKRVYRPSALGAILKCNHNPNWAYLLRIQHRQRAGATGAAYLLIFG